MLNNNRKEVMIFSYLSTNNKGFCVVRTTTPEDDVLFINNVLESSIIYFSYNVIAPFLTKNG